MTLERELEKLNPETKIVIGADKGSGWFYFGTAGDIKGIKKAFDDIHKKVPKYVEKIKAKVIKTVTNAPTDINEEEAFKYAEKVAAEYNRYSKWRHNLEQYIPFERRNVVESYFKEDGSKAFIINGWEAGKWFEGDREGESANVFRKRQQHVGK